MGSPAGESDRDDDELPQRQVRVKPFALGKYEVTVARYRQFFAAWTGGYRPADGAGKHLHLKAQGVPVGSGQIETGWQSGWNAQVGAPPAPAGQAFQYTLNVNGRLDDKEEFESIIVKTGTAGDVIAPAVVDDLLTGIPALRQRGLSILGDVGNQAEVTLRLPVLSETGVITPGSFVRYVDGPTTRIGLVRTTSVDGPVQLRQTLGLETHVSP